jgi:transposase-like protein
MSNKKFNSQIVAHTKTVVKNENRPHSCPRCGSENFKSGAGLKPGQESRRCSDCGEFLGYSPVERLKRPKKRPKLGLEPISSILARLEIGGGEA